MTQLSPEYPTTEWLEKQFPMDALSISRIGQRRFELADIIRSKISVLVSVAGPCAMTLDKSIILNQNQRLQDLQNNSPGLFTIQRIPPWKPRSNPNDWHGLETEPETVIQAYQTLCELSPLGSLAIEIGHTSHIGRYGKFLTMAWIGGRNIDNLTLFQKAATEMPDLPLGVKNGLNGEIDTALERVMQINRMRGAKGAPAILIYRGGDNAKTPNEWEKQYKRAHALTEGRIIIDVAHGSEMAHDPNGKFAKSINGQLACIQHVLDIFAQTGIFPQGMMIESSNAPSPTDPTIPEHEAERAFIDLAKLIQERKLTTT